MAPLAVTRRSVVLSVFGTALAMATILEPRQPALAEPKESPNGAARAELFKWFESLGFPSLKKRPFVRVQSRILIGSMPDYQYGFLLQESDSTFKVLRLNLSQSEFDPTSAGPFKPHQASYELGDLQKVANDYLKVLHKPSDEDEFLERLWAKTSQRSELFVLAIACDDAGLNDLAKKLLEEAIALPDDQGNPVGFERFRDVLSDEIAHAEMWSGIRDFGDPYVTRRELLRRFRRIVDRFPSSPHAPRARETAALLEKMIEEDDKHEKARKPDNAKLTKQEQIAEWIFQLRDQNGYQVSQPGACDIFSDPRDGGALGFLEPEKKGMSPALHLVRFGYDAVPQLIEAVDDKRFTRSVGLHRNFYFSHHVLRVGDCAVAILERIAGREFSARPYTKAWTEADTKWLIKAWWAGVQSQRLDQVSIDGAKSGRDSSPAKAK